MGFVIASIREALATAPAISSARLVALRLQRIDAYGEPRLECLVVGRWAREAFEDIRWDEADATSVAQDSAMEIITRTGAGRGLQPIDLADHPEIAAAMAQMDLSELTLEST